MPLRLILLLSLSSLCVASPEYQGWLATSQGDESVLWSLQEQIGSSKTEVSVVLPELQFASVDPSPGLLTTDEFVLSEFNLPEITEYIPPIMNHGLTSLDVAYFGLNLQVNVSESLIDFWNSESPRNNEVTSDVLLATKTLGAQLLTLRQHYHWNDWELIRLIQEIGLQLNEQIDVPLFQWMVLKYLGYEVKLVNQNDHWFLAFASKQTSLNYAEFKLGKISYYLFPDNLVPGHEAHPMNRLYSTALDTELPMVVYHQKDFKIGQRFNLLLSGDAYFGSGWSELLLSYQGGNIRLPVSVTRIQALKAMPLLSLGDLLNQDMPAYQSLLLESRTKEILSGFELQQKKQWLQRLVHSNFSDQLPEKHEAMAALLGIKAYKNKSYIRAYMLLHLLDMMGVDTVVAIETSSSVFIAARDDDITTSPVIVNNKFYVPIDMNGQPSLLSESLGETEPFDIFILN